jgi:hypothetical protein
MVNYSNGKIYKIEPISGEDGDIYIGSTTKKLLSQRMTKHRSDYKEWKNGTITKTTSFDLFEKYGLENCKIILLENLNANSKDELISREAFYIRTLKCVNKVIPDRTRKEYREDKKDEIKEYEKKHREEHKVYYIEYDKIRRQKTFICVCGCTGKMNHKTRHEKTKKHLEFISRIES